MKILNYVIESFAVNQYILFFVFSEYYYFVMHLYNQLCINNNNNNNKDSSYVANWINYFTKDYLKCCLEKMKNM